MSTRLLSLVLLLLTLARPSAAGVVTQFRGGSLTLLGHRFGPSAVHGTIARGLHRVPPADEYVLDYWVKAREGWEAGLGGKLAGLGGGSYTSGCDPISPDGWSARVMWRPGSALEAYLYHQARQSTCGDGTPIPAARLTSTQWVRLTQRVRVNTPDEANGILQIWVNGQPAYSRTNLRLRGPVGSSTAKVDRIFIQPFRGGQSSAWAVPHDTTLDWSPFFVLDCVPTFGSGTPTTAPSCHGQPPDDRPPVDDGTVATQAPRHLRILGKGVSP